jgi:hypothetical protein
MIFAPAKLEKKSGAHEWPVFPNPQLLDVSKELNPLP